MRIFIFLLLIALNFSCTFSDKPLVEWNIYRGNNESTAYSELDQINKHNVKDLEIAWIYRSNDMGETIECNPIIIDTIMYVTSPALKVVALNAETGKELWRFDPFVKSQANGVNRGVTYWESSDKKEARIFSSADNYLFALDALTGNLIKSFGKDGFVDLRKELGKKNIEDLFVKVSSPGIIYKNLLIIGLQTGEGEYAAPGNIRAFDVMSGEIVWNFNTIPKKGEYGYEEWINEPADHIGAGNVWSGFSLDEKRGIVYGGTGSFAPDFYGGDRLGSNLFANSLIALDANSGERIWHYQIIHHDLWDYDLPAAPILVNVTTHGSSTDAVAQLTKSGMVYLFNRETGEPIFEINEVKVPESDIPGERSWPTQPIPVKPKPFVRTEYTKEDLPTISKESREYAIDALANVRNEGLFTPPSFEGSVILPGFRGGAEWNGGAFDPETGNIYVNANEIPNISKLTAIDDDPTGMKKGRNLYLTHCASCHGINRGGQSQYPSLIRIHERMENIVIQERIKYGRGMMPPFPQLDKDEIDDIVDYLTNELSHDSLNELSINTGNRLKYAHSGYSQFLDPDGYPAIKPPWGTLSSINLNEGEIKWQIPLGEFSELSERGIPPTGTQNFGGCIVTKGGLIFVGASKDEKFRAIDKHTGEILWEYKLPVGGYATPSTYQLNGKQYVVIGAGGGGKNNTKRGDYYIAFYLR